MVALIGEAYNKNADLCWNSKTKPMQIYWESSINKSKTIKVVELMLTLSKRIIAWH